MVKRSQSSPKTKPAFRGALICVRDGYVYGWAMTIDHRPALVDIYLNGQLIKSVRSGLTLPSVFDVSPDARGFGFACPLEPHHISSAVTVTAGISNHCMEFKESICVTSELESKKSEGAFAVLGEVESITGLRVQGWILANHSAGERIKRVYAVNRGQKIASATASGRSACAQSYGLAGVALRFSLSLPEHLANGELHTLHLCDEHGALFGGSIEVQLASVNLAHWISTLEIQDSKKRLLLAHAKQWQRAAPQSLGFDHYQTWYDCFFAPAATGRKKKSNTPEDNCQRLAFLPYGPGDVLDTKSIPPDKDVVVLYDHRCQLKLEAMPAVAACFKDSTVQLIYGDGELKIDEPNGESRVVPRFHGCWDPLYAAQKPDLFEVVALRVDFLALFDRTRIADIAWEVAASLVHKNNAVMHIPRITHRRDEHSGQNLPSPETLTQFLCELEGRPKLIEQGYRKDAHCAINVLRWPDPKTWPRVSVIIPTRDRMDLLLVCLSGLKATDYPHLEIIVIDNQSQEAHSQATFASLKSEGIQVLHWDYPFNYSSLCNAGVAVANGDLICLLNNDIEIKSSDWLKAMVCLLGPAVGIVGAKLLWPNNLVQHAGVLLGQHGLAGHMGAAWNETDSGFEALNQITRQVSAVTGACLLVRASDYRAIGGLCEDLPVAFNDLDFCLRVRRELGKSILWAANAVLIHKESVSRGHDDTPMKRARLARDITMIRKRHAAGDLEDIFYSPFLSLDQYSHTGLATPPRTSC